MQTCLWIGNTTRIGCSGYQWVLGGNRIVYNNGKDYAPNYYCARTWVSNILVYTECNYGG